MKNYKQLMEDAETNEELSRKIEEADKQLRRSGNKTAFIKTAAELGYEVTGQELSGGDDLVKLDDEQLDDVAGGILFFGEEAEDGHEIGCYKHWYKDVNPELCGESNSGKHGFEYRYDENRHDGMYTETVAKIYACKYCGTTARKPVSRF